MSRFPIPPRRKTWAAAFALLATCCGLSHAQNFSIMVVDADPLGLGDFVPDLVTTDLGLNGNLKGDFRYGVGVQSTYSSNFFQSEDSAEGEFSNYLSPWLSYTSDPEGGAAITVAGNYRPAGRYYVENDELNGWDQTGDLNFTFQGARTQVSVFGSYSQTSGIDLLTGDFLSSTVKSGGIRVNRQVATRTSLDASWTASSSDFDSEEGIGADVYTTSVGGYWAATERLSFGPTFRYTVSKSETIGTINAYALMASLRYQMAEKFFLSAAVGPEYSTYEDGDSTTNVSVNFAASYTINDQWSCTGSLATAVAPSSSQAGSIINNWTLSGTLNRRLVRGYLSGGIDCNFSGDSTLDTVGDIQNKQQNYGTFIQYQHPFFSDRIGFNSELRYVFNTGSSDWSEVQVSAGLSVAF